MIKTLEELKDFARKINEANKNSDEETAFDKLMNALVKSGLDENQAEQMIVDCIEEFCEMDEIQASLNIAK